jgi:hypothetical protein
MAKAETDRKKILFTSKLGLNLRKKLTKCYIWSMALYVAGNLNIRNIVLPEKVNRVTAAPYAGSC